MQNDALARVRQANAAYDNGNMTDRFGQVFGQIGQYSSGLSQAYTGATDVNQKINPTYQSSFQQLLTKASNIGRTAESLGGLALGYVKNSAVDIYQKAFNTAKLPVDIGYQLTQVRAYQDHAKGLSNKQDAIMQAYKEGKMSKEDYVKSLNDLSSAYSELNNSNKNLIQQDSPQKKAYDMVQTAVTLLSFGSLGLADSTISSQLVAQGGKNLVNKELTDSIITQGATKLEKLLMSDLPVLGNPVKSLISRNLTEVAGQHIATESAFQFFQRNATKLAADMLIKRPVFYQSNITQANDLYHNLVKGNYKGAVTDAAWLGMQMIEGGPLGAAKNLAGYTTSGIKKLAVGKGSLIDELSTRIGTGESDQIAKTLTSLSKEEYRAMQVMEQSNLFLTQGDVKRAADNIMRTWSSLSPAELQKLTPQEFIQQALNHRTADELWHAASISGKIGMPVKEAARYTPVRWDAGMRNTAHDIILKAGDDKEAALKALHDFLDQPSVGAGNNQNLVTELEKIINTTDTALERAKKIQAIDAAVVSATGVPKALQKKIAALGYIMAEPLGGRAKPFIEADNLPKLISGAIKDPSLFDPSSHPAPVVSQIASAMRHFGVSPQEANGAGVRELSKSIAGTLHGTEVAAKLGFDYAGKDPAMGGQIMASKLQEFLDNKHGIAFLDRISAGKSALVDIRQMTLNEIQQALETKVEGKVVKLTRQDAKEVRSAILKAHQQVPLELRGLGDKAVDLLYQYNPLQKEYARIQSALRYTYNPFFRVQESTETKIGAHAYAGNLLWGKSKEELNANADILQKAGIFSGGLPGEAAGASGDVIIGRISANLTGGQKRDLAGLAMHIADTMGMPLDKAVKENPQAIKDALKIIVQYPDKGLLSSPLARTMNLVFFPMRYNAKVTQMAAEVLSKEPPVIQTAVLHSLFTAKDWLKSDEGIRWQSDNADAISLFSWLTPVNSITSTLNLLSGNHQWADMGRLGGLPFGLIAQMLDSQGIINLNRPYINPSTGQVMPKTIPQSTKARAATAIVDILNSMFTYPGRTLGLPGKDQSLKNFVSTFIATQPKDFQKKIQMDRLTPLQQQWVRVLGGDTSKQAIDKLYYSPRPGGFQGYTLPPNTLPFNPSFDTSSKYKAPKVPKSLTKTKKYVPVTKVPL